MAGVGCYPGKEIAEGSHMCKTHSREEYESCEGNKAYQGCPTYRGTAQNVGQLRALLEGLDDDFPVRVLTMSHEFPPDVKLHARCVVLEP